MRTAVRGTPAGSGASPALPAAAGVSPLRRALVKHVCGPRALASGLTRAASLVRIIAGRGDASAASPWMTQPSSRVPNMAGAGCQI